jgi:hypothetical protein
MNDKKHRILLFALGISLGVLAGGAFVYFSNKGNDKNTVSESFIDDIVNRVAGLIRSKDDEKKKVNETKSAKSVKQKSTKVTDDKEQEEGDEINTSDSLSVRNVIVGTSDSILVDSMDINFNQENIVVKKDVLLTSNNIFMYNLDVPDKGELHSDSLLELSSGLKDEKKIVNAKYSFNVEYWQSPINYKGYKLGKNKLVLFGFDTGSAAKMYYYKDEVYLKQKEIYYRLEYTNDFKALERVVSNTITSQLQQSKL